MSKYTFPNRPIYPVTGSRKLREALDAWRKQFKKNPNYFNEETFKKIIDEVIINDVIDKAKKENNEEEIKEFLEDFSTRIGEDEEKKTKG